MRCSPKTNTNKTIYIFSWILFLLCSIGLLTLGYQCVEKFLKAPQSVDVTTHSQLELDFPAITFCPTGLMNPPSLNIENLKKCGLTIKDLSNGNWIGNCTDQKEFWESIHLKLTDLGFKKIWVTLTDLSVRELDIDSNNSNWKRFLQIGYEEEFKTCFSLILQNRVADIKNININIEISRFFESFVYFVLIFC